jgi:hypothetical protein
MARSDGVSARTKKGLIDSGAMTPEDVGVKKPVRTPVAAPPQPTRGIGKQLANQAEYDKVAAAQKAKADANRQRMIDERARQKLRGY